MPNANRYECAQTLVNQEFVIAPTAWFHWSRAGISILFIIGFQAFDKLYLNMHFKQIYGGRDDADVPPYNKTP